MTLLCRGRASHFGSFLGSARRDTVHKGFCELEALLEICAQPRCPLAPAKFLGPKKDSSRRQLDSAIFSFALVLSGYSKNGTCLGEPNHMWHWENYPKVWENSNWSYSYDDLLIKCFQNWSQIKHFVLILLDFNSLIRRSATLLL